MARNSADFNKEFGMYKCLATLTIMVMALFMASGCNDPNTESPDIYIEACNNCCDGDTIACYDGNTCLQQPELIVGLDTSSPLQLHPVGDRILATVQITCANAQNCQIYEWELLLVGNFWPVERVWIEDEFGNELTERVWPDYPNHDVTFSDNLNIEGTALIRVMGEVTWGKPPDDPNLEFDTFNVLLLGLESNVEVTGLPVESHDLVSTWIAVEYYTASLSPFSPAGLIVPGYGMDIMEFTLDTSGEDIGVGVFYFKIMQTIDAWVSNCQLWQDGGNINYEIYHYWDSYSHVWRVDFVTPDWDNPGVWINGNPATFNLFCDVTVTNPDQAIQIQLEDITVNQSGVEQGIYYQSRNNCPMLWGNVLLF